MNAMLMSDVTTGSCTAADNDIVREFMVNAEQGAANLNNIVIMPLTYNYAAPLNLATTVSPPPTPSPTTAPPHYSGTQG